MRQLFFRRGDTSTNRRRKAEGDQAALVFLASVAIGGGTMILIRAVAGEGLLGEALGFLGMWAAIFPLARRTWAAEVPASHYWLAAVTAMIIGAALRFVTR